jgi:ankyrin repeat protein
VLRLLADHGAQLDRPAGETWRGAVPLRTAYQHAVLRGRTENAALLAELGASTDVAPEDVALAAITRDERPDGPLPDPLDPDAQEVVILAALRGHLDIVIEVFGPDFRGVVGGSPVGSLLHHAAWFGEPGLVRELLARGADPSGGGGAPGEKPLSWAAHGSSQYQLPGRDYVAVAEALAAAGNEIDPSFLEMADGPLYGWLSRAR